MGGAGAALCKSKNYGNDKTQAYVASRIIRCELDRFFSEEIEPNSEQTKNIASKLKDRIRKCLNSEIEQYSSAKKAVLKSKLVRQYPTTMAVVALYEHNGNWFVDSYWAGDSRCYLWKEDGFFQISKDDLAESNDPMRNLYNDAPISNCICADSEFVINFMPLTCKIPAIILCATDGCFGYYKTPMHFEYILRTSLGRARDKEEWINNIREEFIKVTGDDCSLSLIAIGFSSFNDLKEKMKDCGNEITAIVEAEREIVNLEERLQTKKIEFVDKSNSAWNEYSKHYMKYLISPTSETDKDA